LETRTGTATTKLRFFLSDLGEHKAILGYPWFMAVQPNIDWKRGWIDHTQLPIVLRAPDDTILTLFSLSPVTDMVVDSLPKLFLAYCMLADSDDIMSDDDRVVPRGSDLDPVPLLTGCALGLSASFLSRFR
jgi:hypothetical protein